jgi:cytochrome d ubiquinol oxidase subunit II
LPDMERAFRARALIAGVASGVVAIGGLIVLRDDARPLFDGLTSDGGLVFVVASAIAGGMTLWLVWAKRYETARFTAAAAVACVTVGWAFAQSPYLLPEHLTLENAAAGDATLIATLVGVGIGMLVLVPSLYLLYSLTLKGRLDQQFEPLDQRFRPLSAGDPRGER